MECLGHLHQALVMSSGFDGMPWPPPGAAPIGTAGTGVGDAKPPFRAAPGQPEAACEGGCYALELPSTHSPPQLQVLAGLLKTLTLAGTSLRPL